MELKKENGLKTYSIVVHGRVQGVGFRYFTLKQANQYNIYGWVKNQVNGTVLVYAQGIEIRSFINKLREGPLFAEVTDLEVTEIVGREKYENFRIR